LKIVNRPYQDEAIQAAMECSNGVISAATGCGKSVVASGIVQRSQGKTLVLQPSAEILKSNIQKIHWAGVLDATAYSASYGEKKMSHTVYATIGSIIKKLDLFDGFENIIVDECHNVNSSGGMYKTLIDELKPKRLIGLTATPYRQHRNSMGSETRMITRTRPKIFKEIIYNINPWELVEKGFLVNPEFHEIKTDDNILVVNSTGGDYTKESLTLFIQENDIEGKVLDVVKSIHDTFSSVLIFATDVASSVEIVRRIRELGFSACEINALTKKKERRENLEKFNSGEIQFVSNVGTLTTGYDNPRLDCIIDARPIRSPALHYQKIGRIARIFEGKRASVFDLSGNYKRMGNPLKYEIRETRKGYHDLFNEFGQVTPNRSNQSAGSAKFKMFYSQETPMPWGKHAGVKIKDIPISYVRWMLDNAKNLDPSVAVAFKARIKSGPALISSNRMSNINDDGSFYL